MRSSTGCCTSSSGLRPRTPTSSPSIPPRSPGRAREGAPLAQTPRNAAAGTMRNLEPAHVAKRRLSALTYQVVLPADPDLPPQGGSYGSGGSHGSIDDPVASALRRKGTHSETL